MKKELFTMMLMLLMMTAVVVSGCSSDDTPDGSENGGQPKTAAFEKVDLTVPLSLQNYDSQKVFARVKFNIMFEGGLWPADYNFFDDTRIFLSSVTIDGFRMEGFLASNGSTSEKNTWWESDGQSELVFSEITFYDGRKNWAEGSVNGEDPNETLLGLNTLLTQNYAPVNNDKWSAEKNPGITTQEQSLFAYSNTCNVGDGYFYVIPRNQQKGVDMTILYHVETIDTKVDGLLSDGVTHGLNVEQKDKMSDILGADIDFEPGKSYLINIVLGTDKGPKAETTISDWKE